MQGTGNGHIARAREIIPILQKHCEVDVWLSGNQSEVELPVAPKYKMRGLVLFYNKNGGVSYVKTMLRNNFFVALKEIWKAPVKEYDIVFNDFEFTTARASRLRKVRCVQLSHQGAFKWIDSPRPNSKNWLGELILKYYSGGQECYGFHFYPYHSNIFPPVIRTEIREARPQNKGHYTIYLPAFHHDVLKEFLNPFYKIKWQIFSKFTDEEIEYHNINIKPIHNETFIESFINCAGIICGAGFEAPAEAMHLGKKLVVLPIKYQYEQYCNAAALKMEGVLVLKNLDFNARESIKKWIAAPQPEPNQYPNYIENLLLKILEKGR